MFPFLFLWFGKFRAQDVAQINKSWGTCKFYFYPRISSLISFYWQFSFSFIITIKLFFFHLCILSYSIHLFLFISLNLLWACFSVQFILQSLHTSEVTIICQSLQWAAFMKKQETSGWKTYRWREKTETYINHNITKLLPEI